MFKHVVTLSSFIGPPPKPPRKRHGCMSRNAKRDFKVRARAYHRNAKHSKMMLCIAQNMAAFTGYLFSEPSHTEQILPAVKLFMPTYTYDP